MPHLRSQRGLSRARNVGLCALTGDVVAFPDDDCRYAPDLLERVARRFAGDQALDGLTGRAVDDDGATDPSWEQNAAVLEPNNLWNRVISFTIFLRRALVERVGTFDERLGLGSGTLWSSGEEIEYVLRALRSGARVEYDPGLTVTHPRKAYTSGPSCGRWGFETERASAGSSGATATERARQRECSSARSEERQPPSPAGT